MKRDWGWHSLRAQGKCGWCGGEPMEGKTLCDRCAIKSRAKNKAYHARKRAGLADGNQGKLSNAALAAAGRCGRCHLLNPCVCLPTIEEVAAGRRDGGEGSVVRGGASGTTRAGAVSR